MHRTHFPGIVRKGVSRGVASLGQFLAHFRQEMQLAAVTGVAMPGLRSL
jgi:hypothetical protein